MKEPTADKLELQAELLDRAHKLDLILGEVKKRYIRCFFFQALQEPESVEPKAAEMALHECNACRDRRICKTLVILDIGRWNSTGDE